jgi:hypothetical protein
MPEAGMIKEFQQTRVSGKSLLGSDSILQSK